MPALPSLPYVILDNILKALYHDCISIVDEGQSILSRMKNFMPVTAVCREWRECALGHFCSTAICEFIQSKDAYDNHCENGYWRTNVGIIVSSQYSRNTKTIIIKTASQGELNQTDSPNKALEDTDHGLAYTLKQHGFESTSWGNICRMNIIKVFDNILDASPFEPGQNLFGSRAFYNYSLKHMPNIRSIFVDYLSEDPMDYPHLSTLILDYAPNLKYIAAPVTYPAIMFEHVSMKLSHISSNAPLDLFHTLKYIQRQIIKHLDIVQSPYNRLLDNIFKHNTVKLEYNSLETLNLDLSGMHYADMPVITKYISILDSISYPKLKALSISNYNHSIADLLLTFPLSQLTTLEICNSCKDLDKLDPSHLSSLRKLKIDVASAENPEKLNKFVRTLFNTSLPLNHISISVSDKRFTLPETSRLNELRTFEISQAFSWRSLSHLLARLEKLKTLIINFSGNDKQSTHKFIEDVNSQSWHFHNIDISTSIEEIIVTHGPRTPEHMASVCYLIMRMPSLIRLRIHPEYQDQIRRVLNGGVNKTELGPNIADLIGDYYSYRCKSLKSW